MPRIEPETLEDRLEARATASGKRIEDMMVEAILTNHTCGEGCWYAREKVCRCSCGGKNHGCLLDGSTERPARTSKIDGVLYQLTAVGKYSELYRQAQDELKTLGPKETSSTGYRYFWSATEAGSPIRLKCATKQQLGSWTEVSGVSGAYLLWRKVEGLKEG